jgi:RNA polymerase subunit RPABC4/transcription elongation factor Spt4
MSYRCPNCQAVVQRAHICTRCGAPQATRHIRGLVIGIGSVLAIAAFSIATVALQHPGLHHKIDHDHTVGDWGEYEGNEIAPPAVPRANEPSIFTTLTSSDAGIW